MVEWLVHIEFGACNEYGTGKSGQMMCVNPHLAKQALLVGDSELGPPHQKLFAAGDVGAPGKLSRREPVGSRLHQHFNIQSGTELSGTC